MTTAREIMSSDPVTCTLDTPMNEAARAMWEHDIGMLPVTGDDDRVVGTITDRDVAMAAYTQGRPLCEIPVRTAASREAHCVPPAASISEIERVMCEQQVRRLPVVDRRGRALGVVSLGDLARRVTTRPGSLPTPMGVAATLRALSQPRSAMDSRYAVEAAE